MGASLSLHGDEGRALATSAFIFDLGPERVLDVADAVRPHHDNNGLPRRLGPARHVASILDRGSRRLAHHYALGLSDLGGPLDALGRGDVAPLVHNATRRVAQLGRRLAWVINSSVADSSQGWGRKGRRVMASGLQAYRRR